MKICDINNFTEISSKLPPWSFSVYMIQLFIAIDIPSVIFLFLSRIAKLVFNYGCTTKNSVVRDLTHDYGRIAELSDDYYSRRKILLAMAWWK